MASVGSVEGEKCVKEGDDSSVKMLSNVNSLCKRNGINHTSFYGEKYRKSIEDKRNKCVFSVGTRINRINGIAKTTVKPSVTLSVSGHGCRTRRENKTSLPLSTRKTRQTSRINKEEIRLRSSRREKPLDESDDCTNNNHKASEPRRNCHQEAKRLSCQQTSRRHSNHHDTRTNGNHHDTRTHSNHHDTRTHSNHHETRANSSHRQSKTIVISRESKVHHGSRTHGSHKESKSPGTPRETRACSNNSEAKTHVSPHDTRTHSHKHEPKKYGIQNDRTTERPNFHQEIFVAKEDTTELLTKASELFNGVKRFKPADSPVVEDYHKSQKDCHSGVVNGTKSPWYGQVLDAALLKTIQNSRLTQNGCCVRSLLSPDPSRSGTPTLCSASDIAQTAFTSQAGDSASSSQSSRCSSGKSTGVLSASSPFSSQGRAPPPHVLRRSNSQTSDSSASQKTEDWASCQWTDCVAQVATGTLSDHLKTAHVDTQSGDSFTCLWRGCKVYSKKSSSRTWLDRHVLAHSGDKPFRCIVDGCGVRFASHFLLERHVNSHFDTYQPLQSRPLRSREDTPSKALKKRKIKQNKPWQIKTDDFFDSRIMEYIRHKLVTLDDRVDTTGSGSSIAFRSSVIARRCSNSGQTEVLLHWTPDQILPDEWVTESQAEQRLSCSIPLTSLPQEAILNIDSSFYVQHRYRKHRRK